MIFFFFFVFKNKKNRNSYVIIKCVFFYLISKEQKLLLIILISNLIGLSLQYNQAIINNMIKSPDFFILFYLLVESYYLSNVTRVFLEIPYHQLYLKKIPKKV